MRASLLALSILHFLPTILSHPVSDVSETDKQDAGCGYMIGDFDAATMMTDDMYCHTLAQGVNIKSYSVYQHCNCLFWATDSCPGVARLLVIGELAQGFSPDLVDNIRSWGCYTRAEGSANVTAEGSGIATADDPVIVIADVIIGYRGQGV